MGAVVPLLVSSEKAEGKRLEIGHNPPTPLFLLTLVLNQLLQELKAGGDDAHRLLCRVRLVEPEEEANAGRQRRVADHGLVLLALGRQPRHAHHVVVA